MREDRSVLRRWGAAALAAGCLGFGACGDDGDAVGQAGTTTTEAAEEATTTAAGEPTTTTAGAEAERPTLATTGEDLVAVFTSLQAYKLSLGTSPDPALVADVVVVGSDLYETILAIQERQVSEGLRYTEPELTFSDVRITQPPTDLDRDVALIQAIETVNPNAEVVDESGEVVEPPRDDPSVRVIYALRRAEDGRWRIESSTVLGAVG
jgi:hypothetical protein